MKPESELPEHGTGFVGRGGRALFFGLALAPGLALVARALLIDPPSLVPALVAGLLLFVFVMLALLVAGRTVEYVRDKEWRSSPDSLANAPRLLRLLVFAWIAISSVIVLVQLIYNGMPWSVILVLVGWNVVSTWLLAHFFAVKIFRFVERLVNRGKQGL